MFQCYYCGKPFIHLIISVARSHNSSNTFWEWGESGKQAMFIYIYVWIHSGCSQKERKFGNSPNKLIPKLYLKGKKKSSSKHASDMTQYTEFANMVVLWSTPLSQTSKCLFRLHKYQLAWRCIQFTCSIHRFFYSRLLLCHLLEL